MQLHFISLYFYNINNITNVGYLPVHPVLNILNNLDKHKFKIGFKN
jgi:hypothetical protein